MSSYAARRISAWDECTFAALQARWREAGLALEGFVDDGFPPVHVRSYILGLTGFAASRSALSRRLQLISRTMVPTALLWAERAA